MPIYLHVGIVIHLSNKEIGSRNYSNAEVYADRRDVAYWTNSAKRAAAPEFLVPSFDGSTELLRLYPNLQTTDGEREIVRGVSLIDLTGHTPGHIGVRIADGGKSLIMASDMLFPVVHPAHPEAGFLFEQDRPAARAMRERFFPRAAEEKTLVAATHTPFPGLGRIVSDRGEYHWRRRSGLFKIEPLTSEPSPSHWASRRRGLLASSIGVLTRNIAQIGLLEGSGEGLFQALSLRRRMTCSSGSCSL